MIKKITTIFLIISFFTLQQTSLCSVNSIDDAAIYKEYLKEKEAKKEKKQKDATVKKLIAFAVVLGVGTISILGIPKLYELYDSKYSEKARVNNATNIEDIKNIFKYNLTAPCVIDYSDRRNLSTNDYDNIITNILRPIKRGYKLNDTVFSNENLKLKIIRKSRYLPMNEQKIIEELYIVSEDDYREHIEKDLNDFLQVMNLPKTQNILKGKLDILVTRDKDKLSNKYLADIKNSNPLVTIEVNNKEFQIFDAKMCIGLAILTTKEAVCIAKNN